jgi:hypothetical protein
MRPQPHVQAGIWLDGHKEFPRRVRFALVDDLIELDFAVVDRARDELERFGDRSSLSVSGSPNCARRAWPCSLKTCSGPMSSQYFAPRTGCSNGANQRPRRSQRRAWPECRRSEYRPRPGTSRPGGLHQRVVFVGVRASDRHPGDFIQATEKGFQTASGWPTSSGSDFAAEFLRALSERINDDTTPDDERGRLRKLREATEDVGVRLLAEVMARIAEHQAGL